jgi:hypothetical protein
VGLELRSLSMGEDLVVVLPTLGDLSEGLENDEDVESL